MRALASLWHINTPGIFSLTQIASGALTEVPFNLLQELTTSFYVHPHAKPFCLFKLYPGLTFIYTNKTLNSVQAFGLTEETELPLSLRRKLEENRNFVSS